MAGFPFIDGMLFVGGIDISDWVRGADLNIPDEVVTMQRVMRQVTERHHRIINTWELTARLTQDFGASPAPWQALFPLKGTVVAWRYRATSGAIATTNPEAQSNGLLILNNFLSGNFGDEPELGIRIVPSGASPDLVLDTTP